MWATTIFTIAALGLAASVVQGRAITEAPRGEMAARHMIREVVAEMSATPFSEVAAAFHGRAFAVAGLQSLAGDADGFAGEIAFAYGPDAEAASYEVTVRVRWHDRSGDREIETKIWLANVHGDTAAPPSLESLGKGGWQVPYTSGMTMGLEPLEELKKLKEVVLP